MQNSTYNTITSMFNNEEKKIRICTFICLYIFKSWKNTQETNESGYQQSGEEKANGRQDEGKISHCIHLMLLNFLAM